MITVNNQKPTELPVDYTDNLAKDLDILKIVSDCVIEPIFTPIVPSVPVEVLDDNTQLDATAISSLVLSCCGDQVNTSTEAKMKEIFSQTLPYYDKSLNLQEVYAIQSGVKNNMYIPSDKVIYNEADVIDASKKLLSGQITPECFFANVEFYARLNLLGFYFANEAAFDDFKAWFASQIQTIQSLLTPETVNLCNELQKKRLNHLTEGMILRDDTTQNNEPYSFARILRSYLSTYAKIQQASNLPYMSGIMPFSFSETVCPTTILLFNVEKHAHAHPAEIKTEYDILKNALMMKPKVYGLNKIQNLTAVARMAQKMAGQAAAGSLGGMKSAVIKFRKTPPTSVDIYKSIKKIYEHSRLTQMSENAIKLKSISYNRPSRRHPDNPDIPGVTKVTKYKPDLHIYLDCSGSISEREYQDAMKACIKLAKKMNVNMYFNSFSHIMSQTVKLHVQNKTPKQIYEEFKRVPKVGGGTDYEQIWHYINRSKKFSNEVSLVISDFEYTAPNHYVKHPKYLFYAPISNTSWQRMTRDAEYFVKSMLNNCPSIRKHILM